MTRSARWWSGKVKALEDKAAELTEGNDHGLAVIVDELADKIRDELHGVPSGQPVEIDLTDWTIRRFLAMNGYDA